MERKEIEAELNEVERDLADIARRAHIAAVNLNAIAVWRGIWPEGAEYREIADGCFEIEVSAGKLKTTLRQTVEKYSDRKRKPATVAAKEGGAE